MEKLQKLVYALKLDKHHKMERFGVLFVAFCVLFAGIFSYSFYIKQKNSQLQLTSQVIYTSKTKWSLSGNQVSVDDVYRNKDTTKTFIVLNIGDTSTMSTSANDYVVFLGSNREKIQHNITGAIYMFGDTGYMGIELNDARGFEKNLFTIVVRSKVFTSSEKSRDESASSSNDKFNQFTIDLNLSGSDAPVAKSLENEESSVNDLYAECVISKAYEKEKENLAKSLDLLNAGLSKVYEYKRRLDDSGFENTDVPIFMRGDFMTTDKTLTKDNPTEFDPDMFASSSSVITSKYGNESDGDEPEEDMAKFRYVTGEAPYLVTSFVFPGGCQFDYQNISVTDHYINKLIPSGMSYREWKNSKTREMSDYRDKMNTISKFDRSALTLDGMDYAPTVNDEYSVTISNYINAIDQVKRMKETYQTRDIFNLLDIEASILTIDKFTSVNAASNAVLLLGQVQTAQSSQSDQTGEVSQASQTSQDVKVDDTNN